jgi:hypothetical protein
MSKEMETQPYRSFKEILDKIIKMPEELKNRLAKEFERRRLEKNQPKVEEPEQEPAAPDEPVVVEGKKDDKSFFDSLFSKEQTDSLLKQFSEKPPQLVMSNAPEHKCQIRGW